MARGDASVERGGAGQRECGTFDCSSNGWFTRAQAQAYAAGGGGGRKRPRLLERGGAGPRECGSLVAAATAGSPVLKHGPMPPAAEEGVNALGFSRGLSSFVPGRRYGARHLIERDLTDHHSIIFSQPAEMGSIENLKRLS